MVLRLALLAALAALVGADSWTPEPADAPLDPEEIAVLVAAALETDTFRRRR